MATLILLNTIKLAYAGQAMVMRSGDSTADTTLQTAIEDSGGLMAPATDAVVLAASTYIATMRAKGLNEDECDKIMMLAYMASAYATANNDPGSCTGTLPITVTQIGGAATMGINAATDSLPGSMSAADKTKLDGIAALAAVQSVSGTAPISVATGTTTAVVSIVAATEAVPGSMSAADKVILDGLATAWAPPCANITAIKAIAAGSRSEGMLVLNEADNSEWRFSAASTATDTTQNLVLTPTGGTGRWLRIGSKIALTLPFTYSTADAAVLFTVPAGCILAPHDAWWEITTGMTGGTSSAIGVHASRVLTAKGAVLGGASGDVAATLGTATAPFLEVGTVGSGMAAPVRTHLIAADTINFDRVTSVFTAGAGNVRVLCDVIQNLGA